jgi:hypothetical protein
MIIKIGIILFTIMFPMFVIIGIVIIFDGRFKKNLETKSKLNFHILHRDLLDLCNNL